MLKLALRSAPGEVAERRNHPAPASLHPADDRRCRQYFIATIVFYALYMMLVEGEWIFSGGMWAEMATNYFVNAADPSWLVRLFGTDAGYIPIIQRLIALLGNGLWLSPTVIPYYYTASAILLNGVLIGAFCLRPFRDLMPSDGARFLLGLMILVVADFETRTFINFTYFATFLMAALAALALRPEAKTVSPWMWLTPLLALSKPYIFCVAPLAVLVLLLGHPRFKILFSLILVMIGVQITRLTVSMAVGEQMLVNLQPNLPLPDKLWNAFTYATGQLSYLAGPKLVVALFTDLSMMVVLGSILALLLGLFVVWRHRDAAAVLILTGGTLVACTAFINSFALSAIWTGDLHRLENLPIYRHTIPIFYGCGFIIAGLATALAGWVHRRAVVGPAIATAALAAWAVQGSWVNGASTGLKLEFSLGAALLGCAAIIVMMLLAHRRRHHESIVASVTAASVIVVWAMGSGWIDRGLLISRAPGFPITGTGAWSEASKAMNLSHPSYCIPIDPFPWVYGPACDLLAPRPHELLPMEISGDRLELSFPAPPSLESQSVRQITLLIRQHRVLPQLINVALHLTTRDGSEHVLQRQVTVSYSGTSVLFETTGSGISGITGVRLQTDVPAIVMGQRDADQTMAPALVYTGVLSPSSAKQ